MEISGLDTSVENRFAEFRDDMSTFPDIRDLGRFFPRTLLRLIGEMGTRNEDIAEVKISVY